MNKTTDIKMVLRIGSVSFIVGVVLTIIFGALHENLAPMPDPGDTEAILQSVADCPNWAGFHIVIMVSFLAIISGWLVLYRTITGEPGSMLSLLGFTVALMGATILSVSEAILGSGAMKELADIWASAVDKEVPFAVADAMLLISFAGGGIFDWGWVLFYGVTPILYGLAIVLNDFYPKWLGWVAVACGIGNAVIETIHFSRGWGPATGTIWEASMGLLILWMLVMGVIIWRKAGVVKEFEDIK